MNKKIKHIIALVLVVNTFCAVPAITPGSILDITTKTAYAASYSPDDGELKSLKIKSLDGESLDLLDGYYGDTVKLSEDKEYYARLTDESDGIKINADVEDDDYIVKIFTSDNSDATAYDPGDEILLGKGNTTIYVRTYKSKSEFRKVKDNVSDCEEEYTINIKKTTESSYEDGDQDSIYLDKLDLSKGDLKFIKEKTSYDVKVDKGIESMWIKAAPEDSNDRVRINGKLLESSDSYKKTVSLNEGKNEFKIKVTDDKDNQRTYTLNITRGDASKKQDDIYLDDLTLSDGNIDFSKDTSSYTVDLDEDTSKITIGAEPEDEDYLVTINGDEVKSGDDYEKKVSLKKGKNVIDIVIEDEVNDKKRAYTLTINRGQAEDKETTDDDSNKSNNKKSGWVETEKGLKYYDENGNEFKNKWLLDNDKKLYYYLNSDGFKATGWLKDNEKWYLLDKDGVMLTGWQYMDGKWYMLDSSGSMKTGWYKEVNTTQSSNNTNNSTKVNTENTYYLNGDGSMQINWGLIDGKWYYFNTSGQMQKGWLVYSNSKYYLDYNGAMVTGTTTIDGKSYKFTGGGVLVI